MLVLTFKVAYKQQPIKESTWDFLLHTIEFWLSDCGRGHAKCNERTESKAGDSDTILPTRLIDVGLNSDDEPPHLLATSGLSQAKTRYITLSYCWGPSAEAPYKTIQANFERNFRSTIDLRAGNIDCQVIKRSISLDRCALHHTRRSRRFGERDSHYE